MSLYITQLEQILILYLPPKLSVALTLYVLGKFHRTVFGYDEEIKE